MPGKYIHVGDILTCYCDIPLAKRTGEKIFEIMRFYNGKKISVKVTQGDGVNKVGCPDCGYNYTCIGLTDFIHVNDEVITS